MDIIAPANLVQLLNRIKGSQILSCPLPAVAEDQLAFPDLPDIKGQEAQNEPSK